MGEYNQQHPRRCLVEIAAGELMVIDASSNRTISEEINGRMTQDPIHGGTLVLYHILGHMNCGDIP